MNKKLIALFAAAAIGLPGMALAWTPTADVNVVVAYKAGSGTDTGARLLAMEAEKYVGKTLIINNLPGADGKIGWTHLVNAKPDGHTIGFINLPTFTTLATQPNAPFTTAKVVPIVNHLLETSVVVVRADSPYKTMKDLVDAAKAKPNLRASTNGMKASNHTAAQLLAKSAGFKYKAIPYGGTADQLLALRQGEVHFSCAKVADIAKLASGDKPRTARPCRVRHEAHRRIPRRADLGRTRLLSELVRLRTRHRGARRNPGRRDRVLCQCLQEDDGGSRKHRSAQEGRPHHELHGQQGARRTHQEAGSLLPR